MYFFISLVDKKFIGKIMGFVFSIKSIFMYLFII